MGCEVRWLQSQGRAHLSSAALFRCQTSVTPGFSFSWRAPPVCRVQHEVPLRRCEEAERHPTGRLDDWEIAPAVRAEEQQQIGTRMSPKKVWPMNGKVRYGEHLVVLGTG